MTKHASVEVITRCDFNFSFKQLFNSLILKNYTKHNPEENDPAFREAAFPADMEFLIQDLVFLALFE